MPNSTNFSSHSTAILQPPPEQRRVFAAAVCCIRASTHASHEVDLLGSVRPMIDGSASAVPGAIAASARRRRRCVFLGPKVYVASMVVVISAMQDGATAALQKLSQLVGVSRRTIARWRKWWLSVFAASPFWRVAAAVFMPPVDKDRLPASLLERFAGSLQEQLIALLRFLGPIAGGAAMRVA